ncbi:hypothetical protein V8C37DRAFT_79245 [Trichoderma ceciliae]
MLPPAGRLLFQSHDRRLLNQQDDRRSCHVCLLGQPESQHCPRDHLRLRHVTYQYPSIGLRENARDQAMAAAPFLATAPLGKHGTIGAGSRQYLMMRVLCMCTGYQVTAR